MRVVALSAFSTGTLTMEEKQVKDIPDALASELIAKGIVADAATYFGGGSGGGVLVVHDNDDTLDKTWQEIANAVAKSGAALVYEQNGVIVASHAIRDCRYNLKGDVYMVEVGLNVYTASSASDYPSSSEDVS